MVLILVGQVPALFVNVTCRDPCASPAVQLQMLAGPSVSLPSLLFPQIAADCSFAQTTAVPVNTRNVLFAATAAQLAFPRGRQVDRTRSKIEGSCTQRAHLMRAARGESGIDHRGAARIQGDDDPIA